MELKERMKLHEYIEKKLRIHTMELKANIFSCAIALSSSMNPYNGIERAISSCVVVGALGSMRIHTMELKV